MDAPLDKATPPPTPSADARASAEAPAPGEATRRYLRAMDERRAEPIDWDAAPPAHKRYARTERIPLEDGAWAGELLRGLLSVTRIDWEHPHDETGEPVPGRPRLRVARSVPSGGGLYPIDAYVADGRSLCHYDVVHHGLEVVRAGDHRPALEELFARPSAASGLVVGLAARWWRGGFKYGDFAYRLACQEIGVLAAQALALAGPLGLRATVHLDFDARAADRLLGLDPSAEGTLALITVSRRPSTTRTDASSLPSGPAAVPADSPVSVTARLPHLAALHAATQRRSLADADSDPVPPEPDGRLIALPDAPPLGPADGIAHRASPPNGFRPAPIPLSELARILTAACRTSSRELPDIADEPPGVAPYVLALRVPGLPIGVYRYLPDQHVLAEVGDGAALGPLLGGPLRPNTREALRRAAAALVPVGDPLARVGRFGDLWYRIQQAECGLVVHRATLAAHALGRAARIHSDAADAATDTVLGLDATAWRSLGVVFLGSPRMNGPVRRAPAWPARGRPRAAGPNGTRVPEGGMRNVQGLRGPE
ncbi:nitroreductase family protein [Actinomadura harenae]|uniref:hypothetical protein n=1 Tax=Actinomadura harenae TaxID=2483351 RepID=UPI0011C3BF3C|nr:hypothetical protein [Actinomadura harenae]